MSTFVRMRIRSTALSVPHFKFKIRFPLQSDRGIFLSSKNWQYNDDRSPHNVVHTFCEAGGPLAAQSPFAKKPSST